MENKCNHINAENGLKYYQNICVMKYENYNKQFYNFILSIITFLKCINLKFYTNHKNV